MVWLKILLVIFSILILLSIPTGCVKPVPNPIPNPIPKPVPIPTIEPIQPPTLTHTSDIPQEIIDSRFGIVGFQQSYISEIAGMGIRWNKPHVLPSGAFVWGKIERIRGKYDWQATDTYVELMQSHGLATLAEIWPFAEWDQVNWGAVGATTELIWEDRLGHRRCKPYDIDAYRSFVSAMVERYDGDGIDDMPGLKLPIKYWQVMSGIPQPGYETVFEGSPDDYLEISAATRQAVKDADKEAKILNAGMAILRPQSASFWKPMFEKGGQYFDIANTHLVCPSAGRTNSKLIAMAELTVLEFRNQLSGYDINVPIWVTEAGYPVCSDTSLEEQGQILVRSCVASFAAGADKFFYTVFNSRPWDPLDVKQLALIDEGGEKRPAYYAYRKLISKLDKFVSAEKLAEGQFRFTVGEKIIYILWGSGEIPKEITGEVLVTDIYGKGKGTDSSVIKLSESPIFIEGYP